MPSSVNVPSSTSRSRRSRAVSLSAACWRAIRSSPPPSRAARAALVQLLDERAQDGRRGVGAHRVSGIGIRGSAMVATRRASAACGRFVISTPMTFATAADLGEQRPQAAVAEPAGDRPVQAGHRGRVEHVEVEVHEDVAAREQRARAATGRSTSSTPRVSSSTRSPGSTSRTPHITTRVGSSAARRSRPSSHTPHAPRSGTCRRGSRSAWSRASLKSPCASSHSTQRVGAQSREDRASS